jgi:hypothetical protein
MSSAWSRGAATMEGGGRRAHTQEETWTALYRLPGRKRVRREAALQSGGSYKGPAVDDQESAAAGGAGSPR